MLPSFLAVATRRIGDRDARDVVGIERAVQRVRGGGYAIGNITALLPSTWRPPSDRSWVSPSIEWPMPKEMAVSWVPIDCTSYAPAAPVVDHANDGIHRKMSASRIAPVASSV